tara:strand:- start:28 stop:582 length:555 start_codon:yes stop_codon:yes gene_type:complete
MEIILLGRCCRVSFDFEKIGLKQQSSFIEWTDSTYFSDINIILQTYIRTGNIDIIRNSNGNDYLGVTRIHTCHYLNTDYKAIFTRRIMRFIEQVKQSEELLFVRDDVLDTITSDEINEFKNIISMLNPICKYNILVVSKNINNDIISMKNVTNKIYNVDKYIDYIQEITNAPVKFNKLKANDKD